MKKKAQHIAAKVKAPVKVSDKKIKAKPVAEEKEYIKWAAIEVVEENKFGTTILKGLSHSNIYTQIDNYRDIGIYYEVLREGFLTNTNRFVGRAVANDIAFGKPGILESWMLYDDPRYGKE